MRSRFLFLLSALPLAFVATNFVACGAPPKLDDLCGWLGDPNNCYRELAAEAPGQCGAFGVDQQASTGRFSKLADRTNLELCVFDKGGNVRFDPPLDVSTFPLKSASFVITNKNGTGCGAGSFGPNGAFTITIDPSPAVAEGSECVESDAQICGGTFALTPGSGKNFSVTCPSSTSFEFSFEQTATCDETKANGGLEGEQDLDQLIPRAELISNPGSVGVDGFVKFRVHYSLAAPENESLSGKELSVVEYFNCIIPGAQGTCANKVIDEGEADIDCGLACQKGCADMANCEFPQDCESGYCAKDMAGIFKCQKNPNCMSGVKDDFETDVDCGGTQCAACADGLACVENGDCTSNNCVNKLCTVASGSGAGGAGGSGGAGGAGGAGGGP